MPSAKSRQRPRDRVREILNRQTASRAVEDVVREVNAVLRGWGGYFHYGLSQNAMGCLNHFAEQRLRKWLMRRKQRRGPGYSHYPTKAIYEKLGLYRLPTCSPRRRANACG
jgi:hypothetical protein